MMRSKYVITKDLKLVFKSEDKDRYSISELLYFCKVSGLNNIEYPIETDEYSIEMLQMMLISRIEYLYSQFVGYDVNKCKTTRMTGVKRSDKYSKLDILRYLRILGIEDTLKMSDSCQEINRRLKILGIKNPYSLNYNVNKLNDVSKLMDFNVEGTQELMFNFMLKIKSDGRFSYLYGLLYGLLNNSMNILHYIKKHIRLYGIIPYDIQDMIITRIGPCHFNESLRDSKNKRVDGLYYLVNLILQFNYFVKEYDKLKKSKHNKFFKTLEVNLGGRPCLENAIEALTMSIIEIGFEWKGKNKMIMWNEIGKEYYKHGVIGAAVGSYVKSLSSENKQKFKEYSLMDRINMIYNKFKRYPVYVGGIDEYPMFYNVDALPNGEVVTKEAISEYLNYISYESELNNEN